MCSPKKLEGEYTHWQRYHCVCCGEHQTEMAVNVTTPDVEYGMVIQVPDSKQVRQECCHQSLIQATVPDMLGRYEYGDLVSRGRFVVTEPNETEIQVTWMSSEKDEEKNE